MDNNLKRYVADIEANGLLAEVKRIHCIVLKDIDTGEVFSYSDNTDKVPLKPGTLTGSTEDGIRRLNNADLVIGHNWINYDLRLMEKLYPQLTDQDTGNIHDTYLLSKMVFPELERHKNCPASVIKNGERIGIGAHSLQNIGYYVGEGKIENEDWSVFTEHMLNRCISDVEITHRWYNILREELCTGEWKQAIKIENLFRKIICEQEEAGWRFDVCKYEELVHSLDSQLDSMLKELEDKCPRILTALGEIKCPVKKDGTPTINTAKMFGENASCVVGPYCKVQFNRFNPESPKQRVNFLLNCGWKPTEWNYKRDKWNKPMRGPDGNLIKSSPKFTEDSLHTVTNPLGKMLARYTVLSHRRKLVKGIREKCIWKEGKAYAPAGANTVGTNTARCTHRVVVNIPRVSSELGKEVRELFTHDEGYINVGADLKALENRLMGHYTYKYDGGAFANRILNEDPHSRTEEIFTNCGVAIDREVAKTANYALGYQCGHKKLANVVSVDENVGKELHKLWWDDKKPMQHLREELESTMREKGLLVGYNRLVDRAYINTIDGRKIYVRTAHSLLNALIQSAGSIVNKYWTCITWKLVKLNRITANPVGNFHDEQQWQVKEEDEARFVECLYKAIELTNKKFNLLIPMEIDVKLGDNWSEVH